MAALLTGLAFVAGVLYSLWASGSRVTVAIAIASVGIGIVVMDYLFLKAVVSLLPVTSAPAFDVAALSVAVSLAGVALNRIGIVAPQDPSKRDAALSESLSRPGLPIVGGVLPHDGTSSEMPSRNARMYASCDGNFEVFVNGREVFHGVGRGQESPEFSIAVGDLVSVGLSADETTFRKELAGFAAWIVLSSPQGETFVIPPKWKVSAVRDPATAASEEGTDPNVGFGRSAGQGYFRNVPAVQAVKTSSVWCQSPAGVIVYRVREEDLVPVN